MPGVGVASCPDLRALDQRCGHLQSRSESRHRHRTVESRPRLRPGRRPAPLLLRTSCHLLDRRRLRRRTQHLLLGQRRLAQRHLSLEQRRHQFRTDRACRDRPHLRRTGFPRACHRGRPRRLRTPLRRHGGVAVERERQLLRCLLVAKHRNCHAGLLRLDLLLLGLECRHRPFRPDLDHFRSGERRAGRHAGAGHQRRRNVPLRLGDERPRRFPQRVRPEHLAGLCQRSRHLGDGCRSVPGRHPGQRDRSHRTRRPAGLSLSPRARR